MSSSAALQQQLSKLDTPGPVQHYAIAAIFDAACQGRPGSSSQLSAPAEAALLQCLCLQDGQAAAVAAEKLVECIHNNKLDTNVAQSLLLTALAVASAASASPLAAALVSIWCFQLRNEDNSSSGTTTNFKNTNMPWKSHILSKALIASPFAGAELISSVCKILFKYSNKNEEDTRCILTSLIPFLRFVFLDPVVSHRYPQYAMNLHSSLVRTAVASPKSQHAMLRMQCSFLPALPVQSSAQQVFAESCVADIMDLLEACETEPGIDIVNTLVEALVSLCNDISSYGGNSAPFITALASIFLYWPSVVVDASIAGDALPLQLTRLSVVTNGESTLAALSLLCSVLLHRNGNENRNENGDDEKLSLSLAAAVSVQLVPTLAFGQLKDVKEWTSRVLAAVDRYCTNESESASSSLLSMLWSNTSAARCWLHSLKSDLSLIEAPSTNTSSSLFPPTATLLLSLVHHPEAAVAASAVEGVIAAVHAAPLFGIIALPVLIHKLHTTVEKIIMLSSSGENKNKKLEFTEALASVLPTLYALPRLAVHPSTVSFTIRALQPLLAPPAPEFLQGVALRMLCEMWLTTGRGFPHLRTALLSYAAPSGGRRTAITPDMVENPVLRRAWAASLADVCAQDGERAKDLVHSITECLENQEKGPKPAPKVQAAGLKCVAELCEADILDFYKAWKVVKPLVPTLPQHPLAAAAWLRLLASGGLDAAVYPEISRGVLKALWAAACDISLSEVVRNQACASLAAFDFVVLEENDLLSQEMWEYAALLKTSAIITNSISSTTTSTTNDSSSSRSCEELVVHVLHYEHATRRRQRSSGKESTKLTTGKSTGRFPWSNRTRAAAAAVGSDGGARGVQHKLVSTFPKALLGSGSRDPKEFIRRIPDISPIAVLLLWSPPPPSSSQQTSKKTTAPAAAMAAKQAVAAYCSVFAELCKQSDAGFNGTTYTNNSQVLAAWASFLRRWTSAAKDAAAASNAAGATTAPTPNEKTTAGAQAVWHVIKASLQSGNAINSTSSVNVTVVSTAACAAAALASSVFPQPIKLIVEEVFELLTQHDLNGSIFIQAASCTALGHCADASRSILGLPAASAALEVLQRHVANADAPPAVRAASAIGLSLAILKLSSKVNASLQNVGTLVQSLVFSLLATSRVVDAPVNSFLQQTDFHEEDSSKEEEEDIPEEVIDAALIGLSNCLSTTLSVGLPTDMLCTLRTKATEMLLSATRPPLAVHGVCQLLKTSTLVGYKINSITATEVVDTLNHLQQIAATGSGAALTSTNASSARSGGQMKNGKLAGAAALALGNIIPNLIKEGFVFPSSTSSSHYLQSIVLLAKNSSDSKVMSSRGSAKQGAAAGIAAVLSGVVHQSGGGRGGEMGEDVIVVVLNEIEKQAFDVLESLSLKDEDSRARRGCAHALAELCWSARHGGKKLQPLIEDSSTSSTAESATTTILTKGIASLPDNSALRYLCETLESGTWPEVQEPHDNNVVEEKETPLLLTSEQAASVLRCLAAAPRLPVADWSAACRRVLRSHPGSAAVQKGVGLLFSSHASVSQALQMYEFISEDIFGQPGFISWQPEAQYAVLKEMHRLLAALPDAEAASVLRMLCSDTVCPAVFSNSCVDKSTVEWQTALLQGLSATAATMKEDDNLGKIAWECAVHAVLPKVPVPCTWPLGLNLSTLQHYVEKEDSVNNNRIMAPWVQLLTCALTALKSSNSPSVLDRLCSEEIPPATFAKNPIHWTWLCAALVENSGVDLRGLQQPRNFILSGRNSSDGRGSRDRMMDIVLLLVSRAVGSCPTATIAQKQQWIMDILHASENCDAPAAAVTLAVLATVSVASGGESNSSESCVGKAHAVLIDCETAVNALPSSLRYLAETIKPCPVALVTAIVEALGGTTAAIIEERKGKRELQKRCCWALRHALPSETWVELYTRVEGEE